LECKIQTLILAVIILHFRFSFIQEKIALAVHYEIWLFIHFLNTYIGIIVLCIDNFDWQKRKKVMALQTCQLSRCRRETPGFYHFLPISRYEGTFSRFVVLIVKTVVKMTAACADIRFLGILNRNILYV
jgi:hypothetical protein